MTVLSDRLMAIAHMVTPGFRVADIGCDHAYLSIYLTKENISPKVIACDINKGPVEIAKSNISLAGLNDAIEVRLGDGLTKVTAGEVDSIVIAGMGGTLITNILSSGCKVADEAREVILGPQSDVDKVRHFLEKQGYRIISETMVCEDNKFYPVIKAVHGEMHLEEEIYYKYGKILIHEADPVLHEFLILQKKQIAEILEKLHNQNENEGISQRIDELKAELIDCERAILEMEDREGFIMERVISE